MALHVLEDLFHSTSPSFKCNTGARFSSFQIAPSYILILIQCSGLNYISHQAMQSPPCLGEGCSTAVTARIFFQFISYQRLEFISQIRSGLEMYFLNSSLHIWATTREHPLN